jgi:hypothetical protein
MMASAATAELRMILLREGCGLRKRGAAGFVYSPAAPSDQ